ncbi:MAG: HAD family hydrolase [Candidatus Omnitrophota bacterium]
MVISNNMKPALIIFDLDGTLVDAYKPIVRSFNYTMRALGYPKKGAPTIKRAVGWGDANLLAPFIDRKHLAKALLIYREHHKKALLRGVKVLPGARKLLRCIKQNGATLAIASNRPTKFTKIILRRLKMSKYFDYVLCADKLKHGKPNPEIILSIMHKFKASPKDTLYVGDMAIDMQAGNNAKVKSIAVLSGSSTKKELLKAHPHKVLKNVSGILYLCKAG